MAPELICRLERIDPDRNMARFYFTAVRPGLGGQWTVEKEWGRIGSPGTHRVHFCASRDDALDEWQRLGRRKLKRGYYNPLDLEEKLSHHSDD